MAQVTVQPSVGEFRHGLTSCCGDCTLCCIGFLCPNCLAFCASQSAGEGMLTSVCNCIFYPFCLCCLRSTVREKRAIDGSCCGDLMTTLCCPCCGYIQLKSNTEQPGAGEWKNGLFSCFESCSDCLLATFCSPCYACMATKATGEEDLISVVACLCPIALICIRGNAREKRAIEGSFINDCAAICCCGCCALVQMKREFEP